MRFDQSGRHDTVEQNGNEDGLHYLPEGFGLWEAAPLWAGRGSRDGDQRLLVWVSTVW
jgi:hypothetical protein